jgi:hypothetical protein
MVAFNVCMWKGRQPGEYWGAALSILKVWSRECCERHTAMWSSHRCGRGGDGGDRWVRACVCVGGRGGATQKRQGGRGLRGAALGPGEVRHVVDKVLRKTHSYVEQLQVR